MKQTQETNPKAIIGSRVEATKGEWKFNEHDIGHYYVGDIECDLGDRNIRTIACVLKYAGKEESIANGKLICEAVNNYQSLRDSNAELLEALELFINNNWQNAEVEYFNQLQVAFNKAKSLNQ